MHFVIFVRIISIYFPFATCFSMFISLGKKLRKTRRKFQVHFLFHNFHWKRFSHVWSMEPIPSVLHVNSQGNCPNGSRIQKELRWLKKMNLSLHFQQWPYSHKFTVHHYCHSHSLTASPPHSPKISYDKFWGKKIIWMHTATYLDSNAAKLPKITSINYFSHFLRATLKVSYNNQLPYSLLCSKSYAHCFCH